jgi:hypothetical protein
MKRSVPGSRCPGSYRAADAAKKLRVVTTIPADIMRNVAGDFVDVRACDRRRDIHAGR